MRLQSQRLELQPATPSLIQAAIDGPSALAAALAEACGAEVRIPDDWPPLYLDTPALYFMGERLRQDAEQHNWWLYFLLRRASEMHATEQAPREQPLLLLGTAGYKGPPDGHGIVDLGYSIVASEHRRGYATEASNALLSHAFEIPRVRCVIAETFAGITASIGVLEKCGFERVAVDAETGLFRFALTRSRWNRLRERVPLAGVKRICLWSGPRNVSTALLYSFAQRDDTEVLDEPLYAHYLRVSGADHPGREAVLRVMNADGDEVIRNLICGPSRRPVLFQKHMAHHLVDVDRTFLAQMNNVFLVRDPHEVVPSLAQQIPEPTLRDTGLALQWELVQELERAGRPPVILDAKQLLLDPWGVLAALCDRLQIPWTERMLSWEAGPRDFDGIWAPHWYHNVHRSRGFARWQPKAESVPPHLAPLVAECVPYYEELRSRALRASSPDRP